MRDLSTLRRAIDELLEARPQLHFDMIVPRDRRGHPELEAIAGYDRVCWHEDLSDQRLREIYRAARLLFLPLVDCTANNTLLEAMACGLPVVTNDVGGVSDYTDASFAARLPCGDVRGMLEAALHLVDDASEARSRGAHARAHAIRALGWQAAVDRTLALYRVLLS
jgi:glycosyltransferase involved in cell wall biosynthesis